MRSGLSIEEIWSTDARLLAEAAERAGSPGEWTGGDCPGAGTVAPADLAAMVHHFGAYDIVMACSDDEGRDYENAGPDERERMRRRQRFAAAATLASMERGGRAPGGRDLGPEWMVARYWHDYDDHTRQTRPHTHNIVVLVSSADAVTVR